MAVPRTPLWEGGVARQQGDLDSPIAGGVVNSNHYIRTDTWVRVDWRSRRLGMSDNVQACRARARDQVACSTVGLLNPMTSSNWSAHSCQHTRQSVVYYRLERTTDGRGADIVMGERQ